MLKRFAFTLTELLIAIFIIGTIAAISIPNLIEGIHRRQMIAQIKSTYGTLLELAREQMISKNTKNILDTDFADPEKLLSDKYFQITKICGSASDCWKWNGTNTYKAIKGGGTGPTRVDEGNPRTIILKNGQILSYRLTGTQYDYVIDGGKDRGVAIIYVDVNGKDKPNIIGRDTFWFIMTEKGKIVDYYAAKGQPFIYEQAKGVCRTASTLTACLSLLIHDNWEMNY